VLLWATLGRPDDDDPKEYRHPESANPNEFRYPQNGFVVFREFPVCIELI
jgi:hypothetical protein